MTETSKEPNRVSLEFEEGFISQSLESQIRHCDRSPLRSLFLELLPNHQPVLEAGCGSGQWMHFLKRHGVTVVGIDWSETLQARSRAFDPTVTFDTGDLRALPYSDGTFGAVVALGSPEHVIEGPRQIFSEFYRVLRPGGAAIVTVPYLSLIRTASYRLAAEPLRRLKRVAFLRRMAGRPAVAPGNPESPSAVRAKRYRPDIYLELDFDGYFFEYQFTRKQIIEELSSAGFQVQRSFGFDSVTGLIMSLGVIAGRFDRKTYTARMTPLGRVLMRLLSEDQVGHMICCIATKL